LECSQQTKPTGQFVESSHSFDKPLLHAVAPASVQAAALGWPNRPNGQQISSGRAHAESPQATGTIASRGQSDAPPHINMQAVAATITATKVASRMNLCP
jgi:hypothetical protein